MRINILDHVNQCYTQTDGEIIAGLIKSHLKNGDKVVISFQGVCGVPSSFINAAIISLLDEFTFEDIKEKVSFVNSTKQINEIIKNRFDFEVYKRPRMSIA